jgi:hypothetical protein
MQSCTSTIVSVGVKIRQCPPLYAAGMTDLETIVSAPPVGHLLPRKAEGCSR